MLVTLPLGMDPSRTLVLQHSAVNALKELTHHVVPHIYCDV